MSTQQDAPPRERSAFTAGFLSLVFPGLGHAYARAWKRAVIFAAPPLVLVALLAGTYLSYGSVGLTGFLSSQMLVAILVGNVVAYLYRIIAAVDAWRVVAFINRYEKRSSRGLTTPTLRVASIAGLIATCMVMGGVHAAVAYYDSQLISLDQNVHSDSSVDIPTPNPSDLATPPPSIAGLGTSGPSDSPDASETPQPTDWIPGQRLNILLIGSDVRPGDSTYNTDTLIVASIDPDTKQVAMFSLPRDIVGVPLPPGPLRNKWGSTWNNKINSLVTYVRGAKSQLGKYNVKNGEFRALEDTLGSLYGIPIYYFVEVNFAGFENVVDALGGVTINVQKPVVDDFYPGDNGHLRVYIPTGVQHMTGAEALIYARSRHGSSDFDRGARQQRVLLSIRQQIDISTILQPDVLNSLVKSIGKSVRTDFPISNISPALQLAQQIDITNIRSFVFGPPTYATDMWPTSSDVVIKVTPIQRAAKNAFKFDPAALKAMTDVENEGAVVWVLDQPGQTIAADIAGYLIFRGVGASSPTQGATGSQPANTVIKAYGGAETDFPKTVALLQDVFNVKVQVVADPKVKADFVITTGRNTQDLQAPTIGN